MGNAKKIWDFLKSKGFNDYACAGILANFDAESGLNPKNLQDSCQARLGVDDETYTSLVDSGVYTKTQFVYDQAGYSISQWTFWSRKKAFYEFTKSNGQSIGDLDNALNFFYKELSESFPSVMQSLMSARSVREASDIMLLKYECPADMSTATQIKRASFGQKYYTQFVTNSMKGVENMGYLYFTKGQSVKVSEHFVSTEFDCHGSGCCSQTIVNEKLIEYLEKIRNHFNAPITITSPYRCPTHNRRVGGAVGSRHEKGDACDIVVKGVAPRLVAQYAESIGILGIGLYETSKDGYFVHIDTRDYKSFWYGQSEQPRTTFGGYTGSAPNSSGTSNLDTILNMGDSGVAVKELQGKLIRLGYSCGESCDDGDFGDETFKAVCKFQEDHNLGVDGYAGNLTLTAIDNEIAKLATSNGKTYARVTASLLNVRYGAGKQYTVKTTVKNHQILELEEERNGWYKIKTPSGWVSSEYIEKI